MGEPSVAAPFPRMRHRAYCWISVAPGLVGGGCSHSVRACPGDLRAFGIALYVEMVALPAGFSVSAHCLASLPAAFCSETLCEAGARLRTEFAAPMRAQLER
eukprot:6192012-Pleurochrysis_carterae.AAC.2